MATTKEDSLRPPASFENGSYLDRLRSLDPGRPPEELAFDHIHHCDIPAGNAKSTAAEFISQLLVERTNETKLSLQCEAAYELAQSIYDYAGRLLQDVSEQHIEAEEQELLIREIRRRALMWHGAINAHIQDVPGSGRRLEEDRVRAFNSWRRLRV